MPARAKEDGAARKPAVDILIPVLNEEGCLRASVEKLGEFMRAEMSGECDWRVTIVDNDSDDDTPAIGAALAESDPGVEYVRIAERGIGVALRRGMKRSRADVVVYMDADMSADLRCLPALVRAVAFDGYDVAFGSRLLPDSNASNRKPIRILTSRVNSFIIRRMFGYPFRDSQCGFKAFSRNAIESTLDSVEDDAWFFNTEFLLRAYWNGCEMLEMPIAWVDDPDSKVNVRKVSAILLAGYWRLKRERIANGLAGRAWARRPGFLRRQEKGDEG